MVSFMDGSDIFLAAAMDHSLYPQNGRSMASALVDYLVVTPRLYATHVVALKPTISP
jgi:hypothetical protein